MHDGAFQFIANAATAFTEPIAVIEFGSRNVNGSVRRLFPTAHSWLGIDVTPGPDVQLVLDAHHAARIGVAFDLVVCCEMLEHDPDPQASLAAAWDVLRPGGVLLLTAAAPERTPHGCNGGAVGDEHYGAIVPSTLKRWLKAWHDVQIVHQSAIGDVYAIAYKPKE